MLQGKLNVTEHLLGLSGEALWANETKWARRGRSFMTGYILRSFKSRVLEYLQSVVSPLCKMAGGSRPCKMQIGRAHV